METDSGGCHSRQGGCAHVTVIYKLLTRDEWHAAQREGVYRGSTHDLRDGFIHFSTAAQLAGTAQKYFSGVPDLLLLAVDVEGLAGKAGAAGLGVAPGPPVFVHASDLTQGEARAEEACALRWEPARGGDLFPHLYGALPLTAVKSIVALPMGPKGTPVLPLDLR